MGGASLISGLLTPFAVGGSRSQFPAVDSSGVKVPIESAENVAVPCRDFDHSIGKPRCINGVHAASASPFVCSHIMTDRHSPGHLVRLGSSSTIGSRRTADPRNPTPQTRRADP